MTLAAINWLEISINLLLVVFVFVCLMMTLVILMQRPKQEGLGAAFGGGVTDQVFGARTTNVLQRGTVYLGSAFFIIALVLAILIGHKNDQTKLDKDETPPVEEAPLAVPSEDLQPKSLIDDLLEDVPEETDAPSADAPPADAPPADAPPADAPPADAPSVEPPTSDGVTEGSSGSQQ